MKKQLLFGHILPLMIGGLIYLAFRSDTLLMFKWANAMSLDSSIIFLRELNLSNNLLPEWFLYSLPDGLWMFSYISLTLLVWGNKITMQNVFWIFIIPIIAIFSEIGQALQFIPGTYDTTDLIFYGLGTILPLIIYNKLILKTKKL